MSPRKRILITGGAGFIGSNFCHHFLEKYDLTVIDNLQLGTPENLPEGVKFIQGDAGKLEDLKRCGDSFFAIIHLAGTSSAPMFGGEGLVPGYLNSIQSFLVSLEFAREVSAEKFLYASTSSLYGNNPPPLTEDQVVEPPNHYAVTKFCYEHAARCYHQVYPELQLVGFRFMSVYGPREEAKGPYANLVSQFLWDFSRGIAPVVYGDGSQSRDFTEVRDITQALDRALETPELGCDVFNIGRGESTSFNDLIRALQAVLNTDLEPQYIPNPVREQYVQTQHADISKIQQKLGYVPQISLEQGVQDLVEQLKIERIGQTSSENWHRS